MKSVAFLSTAQQIHVEILKPESCIESIGSSMRSPLGGGGVRLMLGGRASIASIGAASLSPASCE